MGFVVNVGVFGTILGDGRKRSGGLRVYVYIATLRLRRSEPVVSDSYSLKSLAIYTYTRSPPLLFLTLHSIHTAKTLYNFYM